MKSQVVEIKKNIPKWVMLPERNHPSAESYHS